MTIEELRKLMSKQRRKPRRIEGSIQTACVNWFRVTYPKYLIFAVPNGGSRHLYEAAHLKEEGALAGVSDLIVLAEKKALFVEMKAKKGRQTDKQKAFEVAVKRLGFAYVICRSLKEFSIEIAKFLKGDE